MYKYTQLSYKERVPIFEGIRNNLSSREIARSIGRSHSTVSREIKRNSDVIGYLYPEKAQQATEKRKARHGSKIIRNHELKQYVIDKMKLGWSPDVIAGTWNKDKPEYGISKESIYSFIYSKDGYSLQLWKVLKRRKKKRGISRRTRKPVGGIPNRVSIHDRPDSINNRNAPGHFEADLFFNKGSQSSNVLNVVERKSRYIFMMKNNTKSTDEVISKVIEAVAHCAQSITFDNGKEFTNHTVLKKDHDICTYFCDPGAPYQKGSVENSNGLLRHYFPFKVPTQTISQADLDRVASIVNHIPRKILNYQTPCEVFSKDFNVKSCCVALHI